MFKDAISLSLFLFLAVSVTADPTFNDDVFGLIVFKAGLDDPLSKLASWNVEDTDPCNWVGCICDPATNRVTELRLDAFSLSGHIGRCLLRLQFLHTLILSNNNLTGTLNPEFPHLASLQVVDFSGNYLSGRICWKYESFIESEAWLEKTKRIRSWEVKENLMVINFLSYC